MKLPVMMCDCGCAAQEADAHNVTVRLFAKDTTLWSENADIQAKIKNRLGWLDAPEAMAPQIPTILEVVEDIKAAGFTHAVLLGMGGSSLCPEVMAKVFGTAPGFLKLLVLDSTSPESVLAVDEEIELSKTLFIPASKSGSTIETNVMLAYYLKKLQDAGISSPGEHFIAITDPESCLAELSKEKGFRHCFLNPPEIGGRFSALSLFGLVPMALLGIDVEELLLRSSEVCSSSSAFALNAVTIGLRLGTIAKKGRNKLSFLMSPTLAPLGDWIEQLVAESTGKEGDGILPVVGELGGVWGNDRVAVKMKLGSEAVRCCGCEEGCETKTITKIDIELTDSLSLGMEFLRWELITAAMGVAMKINPFDEPNVTESKVITGELLKEYVENKKLTLPDFCHDFQGIKVSPSKALKDTIVKSAMPCCSVTDSKDIADLVKLLLSTAVEGDYVTLSAFIAPTAKRMGQLQEIRRNLGRLSKCATTLGIGPRFLHSTGQLHKGGANNGLFLVLTQEPPSSDLAIPGYEYGFGTLCLAQGLGDFNCLNLHERRAILLYTKDVDAMLELLEASLA